MLPKRLMIFTALGAAALGAGCASTRAATLSSDAPGNIFVEKQPLRFLVKDARGAVSLSLRDYAGREVWKGGGATVAIPAQAPGWYQLAARDDGGENVVSLGILLDRKNAPLPRESRVNTDSASAWLVTNEALRVPLAKIVKLAGISWVRERIAWTPIEPQKGQFVWPANVENTAAAFRAEGVHIDQMWHDAPEWTRPGREKTSQAPEDLRDVYLYTRAAARYQDVAAAWEAWNEPDITFWPDLSDRFAGLQKAAYFGMKDGNPQATVVMGGLAGPPGAFARHFFANGGGDYADVYNWHRYADPLSYPDGLADHRQTARENGATDKPWWMTEAGIPLPGTLGEGKQLLTEESQRAQARFVPRAVAMSLAGGDQKYFFFVLPSYLENGTQFGSLKPDLTPYPGFVALSAAANILGVSDYAGTVTAPAGIIARAFDTKNGRIIVAWSETRQTLILPARGNVVVRDIFGALASTRKPQNGKVAVEVGPEAVYISGATPTVMPPAAGILPPSVVKPMAPRVLAKAPSRIVIVGHATLPLSKDQDTYLFGARIMRNQDLPIGSPEVATQLQNTPPDTPIQYTVEAYNFDEKTSRSGSIAVTAPAGWRVEPASQKVQLAPMDRRVLAFTLTPPPKTGVENVVRVSGNFAGQKVAPSSSHFSVDPASLQPVKRQPLGWTNPAQWNPSNTSRAGITTVNRTPNGALRIESIFDKVGDRWAYPTQTFATPQNFAAYDGIAFDLKVEADTPNSVVRLMLAEQGGATYLSAGISGDGNPRRVVLLFRDLEWGTFSPIDPNRKLDLDRITGAQLGLNTPGGKMSFEASNFELVKFAAEIKGRNAKKSGARVLARRTFACAETFFICDV